jgi:hypothetical protein
VSFYHAGYCETAAHPDLASNPGHEYHHSGGGISEIGNVYGFAQNDYEPNWQSQDAHHPINILSSGKIYFPSRTKEVVFREKLRIEDATNIKTGS